MIDVSDMRLSELESRGIEMVVTVCDRTMIWSSRVYESFYPVFSYAELRKIYSLGKKEGLECLLRVYGLKESFSSSVFVSSVSPGVEQYSWLEELSWEGN